MKHLAMLDNYYDILAPQVYTHLSNDDYSALFTLYKVIYPNYVSRIVTTFLSRWALHIRVSQLILSVQTPQGKFALNHMQTTILDVFGCTTSKLSTMAIPSNLPLQPQRRLDGHPTRGILRNSMEWTTSS